MVIEPSFASTTTRGLPSVRQFLGECKIGRKRDHVRLLLGAVRHNLGPVGEFQPRLETEPILAQPGLISELCRATCWTHSTSFNVGSSVVIELSITNFLQWQRRVASFMAGSVVVAAVFFAIVTV